MGLNIVFAVRAGKTMLIVQFNEPLILTLGLGARSVTLDCGAVNNISYLLGIHIVPAIPVLKPCQEGFLATVVRKQPTQDV